MGVCGTSGLSLAITYAHVRMRMLGHLAKMEGSGTRWFAQKRKGCNASWACAIQIFASCSVVH